MKDSNKNAVLSHSEILGYSISFGVKIFGVNFRVNLGVDFWGLLNDLFFSPFLFFILFVLCFS